MTRIIAALLGLLLVSAVFVSTTNAQTINADTENGNNAYYTATKTISGVAHTIHAGTGTIANAFAACPSTNNTPCIVYADPGQSYTIGNTPLSIGNGFPQTLIDDGAVITCNGTAGNDCIDLYEKGQIIGHAAVYPGATNPVSYIGAAGTANITSIITNGNHTNQAGFHLEDIGLSPNTSATITKAELWLSSVDGFGYIANLDTTGPPSGTPIVLIDNSTGNPSYVNDITFVRPGITCSQQSSVTAVKIINSNSNNSDMSNISFIGGAIVDCGSSSTLLDLDGGTSGVLHDVSFFGTYFETSTGFTGDFIDLNNVGDVNLVGVKFNGGPAATNCIKITGSNAGQLIATGRATGSQCTNLINNTISGYTDTTMGDFTYSYGGTNSAGMIVDGHVVTGHDTNTTVGTCGTSPSITGSDSDGRITVGTGTVTSCTITFAKSWGAAPGCEALDETHGFLLKPAPGTSSVSFTSGANNMASDTFDYHCGGAS